MKFMGGMILASLCLSPSAASAGPAISEKTASGELAELCQEYWETLLRSKPIYATFVGEHRYDDRLDDMGSAGINAWRDALRRFGRRADRIKTRPLAPPDAMTLAVLRQRLDMELGRYPHKFYLWNVDYLQGPQILLADLMKFTPLNGEADARALIHRLHAAPAYISQYKAHLRAGVSEGRTAARAAVMRVIGQLDRMLELLPEESPFGEKFVEMPRDIPIRYRAQALSAISDSVYPALRDLRNFFHDFYLPRSRKKNIGLWALPDGAAAYKSRIGYYTTWPLSPNELHQMGLKELGETRAEMKRLYKDHRHRDDLRAVMDDVYGAPSNLFSTREEIIWSARGMLAAAHKKLPDYFIHPPLAACEIRPVERYKDGTAPLAFYYPPDIRGKRPGLYFIGTHNPPAHYRNEQAIAVAHETVPGHHLQIALAVESRLPDFRRMEEFPAFTEGWAFYAEGLADEMGLYETRSSRLAMFKYRALRALRLIVDTGIHAMRWDRDQAVEYMMKQLPLSRGACEAEIDRSLVWPGQPLAYMAGWKEILSLRGQARHELGENFNIKEFHEKILQNGSIPLPLLRRTVREWLTSKARHSKYRGRGGAP